MSVICPITRHIAKRPCIQDIAASLLAPISTCQSRHINFPSRTVRSSCLLIRLYKPLPAFRSLHTSSSKAYSSPPPRSHDRGPASTEKTQTDFSNLDVLGGTPVPSTSIDACLWDGFHLNNGVKITHGAGVLLVGGEAFGWRPWDAGKQKSKRLLNAKGQWEVDEEAWGLLDIVWPKPDLLILGLGPSMAPLSPATRKFINGLGIRVDIQDTRNASAQFNLLATERGLGSVAAALIPMGWREGIGVR